MHIANIATNVITAKTDAVDYERYTIQYRQNTCKLYKI